MIKNIRLNTFDKLQNSKKSALSFFLCSVFFFLFLCMPAEIFAQNQDEIIGTKNSHNSIFFEKDEESNEEIIRVSPKKEKKDEDAYSNFYKENPPPVNIEILSPSVNSYQ